MAKLARIFEVMMFSSRQAAGLLLFGVTAAYGTFVVLLSNHHLSEPVGLVVEYLGVLPATIYFLRSCRDIHTAHLHPYLPNVLSIGVLLCFAIACTTISWACMRGLLNPDESAYDFQSRIFLSGKLMAPPLPGSPANARDTPVEIYYEGHIASSRGWFTKYPPGWPALLSLGNLLHVRWLVNPLLSLLLMFVSVRTYKLLFGPEMLSLIVIFLTLSPFFFVNSVGLMSHMLEAVLVAAACFFLFVGCQRRRLLAFAAMFALLCLALHVRPYTGSIAAAAIIGGALYKVRSERRLFVKLIELTVSFILLSLATICLYNRTYTGHAFLSPYSLAYGVNSVPEISLDPRAVLGNIRRHGRHALQENLFSAFPFLFLLAAIPLFFEPERRAEVYVFAMIYIGLVLAYLLHRFGSGVYWGERFHFEGFAAVCILATRGLDLLVQRWRIPAVSVAVCLCLLLLVQVSKEIVLARAVIHKADIYRQIRSETTAVPSQVGLVFLRESRLFTPKHFNLNDADWPRSSRVYLIDPGQPTRSRLACQFKRPSWEVIGYDDSTSKVFTERGSTDCSSGDTPAR